ncbi:MAG TPA: radical SAM family heme chaperone HemW [Deltaproteobacteria bacterium]|nr:radical SAM family heme chaperone HemW [Deltaproteobacteria bacterium]
MPPAAGLYLHIPFCRSKCAYCDFYSMTDTSLIPRFVTALCNEINQYEEEFLEFDTIYLGGGTPSLLSLEEIESIMEAIWRAFTILPDAEITIEINPADRGRSELAELNDLGINRISIGVQSFDDRELLFMGRRHTAEQAAQTLEDAHGAGFVNIGLDLIYGLPDQTVRRWQSSLGEALRFDPSHLSCYELEIKPCTPLGRRLKRGDFASQNEDTQRDFFVRTSELLEEAGFVHYEVSNFARGMERASRHNQKYWDHTPYLGLGPSAHSFRGARRWWNHESLDDYLHALENGMLPKCGSETINRDELRMEALFLGLRTRKGIDMQQFKNRHGIDLMEIKGSELREWSRAGLIEIEGSHIRPTRSGMIVADALALF